MKKGTLIYVEKTDPMSYTDARAIEENGSLWVVDTDPGFGDDNLLWCKSLATNAEHPWYTWEITHEPS